MRFMFLVCVVCTAVSSVARAQAQTVDVIPFDYRDGLIWIQARATNSPKPLNFLLDSGAAASVLDRRTARELGVKPGNRTTVQGVHATVPAQWAPQFSVRVGQSVFEGKFLLMDLSRQSKACSQKIDGFLGADFFRGHAVEIDFNAQRLRVLTAVMPPDKGQILPLRLSDGAMCVRIDVNDSSNQWVRLDTGCASALQWVKAGKPSTVAARQTSVGLAQVSVGLGWTRVQIGSEHFDAVPAGFHRTQIFAGEAGLLGNGLLQRFRVTVDAPAGRLILERLPDPTAGL